MRVLDMSWDEVHAEAELLEHVLSDRLEERIDAVLGHPTRDPKGDPIPPRRRHEEDWGEPLAHAPAGTRFRVDRVSDGHSDAFSRPVSRGRWVQAELVAIATDLADVPPGAVRPVIPRSGNE